MAQNNEFQPNSMLNTLQFLGHKLVPTNINTVFQFTPTIHHTPYPYISPSKQNLSGRAIFVTGASKGIGRATALSFAVAGASYIAIGARSSLDSLVAELRDTANKAGFSQTKILPLSLDLTDQKTIDKAGKRIEEEFGRLDILVNNAAYLEECVKVADSDPLEWWKSWTVNVNGVYLCTRALLPLLLNTNNGLKTILNVSSIGAINKRPGASAYQTGKLALLRFGEFVDVEYGEEGILCYGIHPGAVMTELASRLPKYTHCLLKDVPELAADTIVWLTGQRKDWLAGRYVSVNWDMEEFEKMREKVVKEDLLKVKITA